MDVVVKSRNGKLTQQQHAYIEEKLAKLERHLDQINKVTIEIAEEQRRNEGSVVRAQVTLVGRGGMLLRAEQRAPEFNAAIDAVQDTMARQIARYKDKHWRRGKLRRQDGEADAADLIDAAPAQIDEDDEETPRLVRTKEIYAKPMFSDEAVEQMELLGHDFFMFRDADSSHICVVYRRVDGNYGMLVPVEIDK